MRLAQEAREHAAALTRQQEIERRQRDLERKRQTLEAQTAALRAQFEAEQDELTRLIAQGQTAAEVVRQDREQMARSRQADQPTEAPNARARRPTPQGGRK